MGDNHPSKSTSHESTTKITDMDEDPLVRCTEYLSFQDISNMSASCRFLNLLASSDSIWRRLFRERWPQLEPCINSGLREAFVARYNALQQFKFADPFDSHVYMEAKSSSSDLLLGKDSVILSQGSLIRIYSIKKLLKGEAIFASLDDHRARITSMRLFPLKETSLFRNESDVNDNVLVTSSCDHSIRLWWKGSCHRRFRGHNGPVTVLSDKLLGDENGKVFASGGEDSTVCLWSLKSTGMRGQHALKATLYGHEKPIVFMSVTGHKDSVIVSMSKDSKVRVWDASVSSGDRNSSCVGTASVPGMPVGMKCHDSLLYIASGFSIGAVDLRTMKTAFRTPVNEGKLYSFDISPSKYLACCGGLGRALLWDIRKFTGTRGSEPMAELDGHTGPVTHLHMDPYKIVTGGPEDPHVNIWAADTGNQTNILSCSPPESPGCFAMAADGFRIATVGYNQEYGILRFRDFNNAVRSASLDEHVTGSKFWRSSTSGDGDESDS